VVNTQGPDGAQIMVLMHVDDLFITSKSSDDYTRLEKCIHDKYKEIKIIIGKVVAYISA
jgi:hypothetical protein